MGILEGKRVLVAGVTLNTSIAYAVAELAQREGATVLVSNFGRALSLTRRVVARPLRARRRLDVFVTGVCPAVGAAGGLL